MDFRLRVSERARASILKARDRWPEIVDHVAKDTAADAVRLWRRLYPRAIVPRVPDSFFTHYRETVEQILAEEEERLLDRGLLSTEEPRRSLLTMLCAVGFVVAATTPRQGVSMLLAVESELENADPETILDTLAMQANAFMTKDNDATDALLKALGRSLKRRKVKADTVQSILQHASYAFAGVTPEVVESIVETGQVPYELKCVVDPAEVRKVYLERGKLFEWGAPVERLASLLTRVAGHDDLVAALKGKGTWPYIYLMLFPFVVHPSVSTASYLSARRLPAAEPHEVWGASIRAFWQRVGGRDRKREQREKGRIAAELDKPVETGEGRVSLHETFPGSPGIEPGLDIVLLGLDLTRRERQVARLLAEGYRQRDISGILGLTPGRVSQIVRQIREEMERGSS